MADGIRDAPPDLPLVEASRRVQRREVSPVELTQAALDRIARDDGNLNAFVTVLAESALADAHHAEREIADGKWRGPLHGIPISVKDLFWTRGVRTTAGSRIMADFIPDEDATVVALLRAAGAVLLGKTNMLEFAYAAVHDDYGPSLNPWDVHRSASGSSSGSAVAVAAGMGYGSLGSDTGGSIRLPAAYTGIVGLKPSYGRVSRHGVVPVSWSADHVGPMTRTVADAAAMLTVIAGADAADPTASTTAVPNYLAALDGRSARPIRVGVPTAWLNRRVAPEVRDIVETAISVLADGGATLTEVALPDPGDAVAALMAILMPEAAAWHLRWLRERPEDYSPAVRERLELGVVTPAVRYLQGQQARRTLTEAFLTAMADVDVLAMPTAPTAATPLESDLTVGDDADPDALAALVDFTAPFDLTGFPAISVPCGFTAAGLPVGMQLVGRPWREDLLLAVAHRYEQATSWHRRMPTEIA